MATKLSILNLKNQHQATEGARLVRKAKATRTRPAPYAEHLRQVMLQSIGDLIEFQKAGEFIAAANDELAA